MLHGAPVTAREWILSRLKLAARGGDAGIRTNRVYSGRHNFALAELDAELTKMRDEGVLGFAMGFWYVRKKEPSP